MKLIIASLALFAVVSAKPTAAPAPPKLVAAAVQQSTNEPIPILKYDNEGVNADGSYQWRVETGNGIVAEEHGQFKPGAKEDEGAEQVQGSFQYTADDGTPVRVEYVADENGYQPQGDNLPTPPPIPAAIARALEYIAAHPQPEEPAQKQ